jgi:hypothetical protein
MARNVPKSSKGPQAARSTGPTSIEGVEASDLPEKGRGSIETDPGHELGRNVPHHTGEVVGSDINSDVGATGHPESRQADQKKFQGRHQGDK